MKLKPMDFFLTIMCAIFLMAGWSAENRYDSAKKGLYTIAEFPTSETVKLNGSWEFYWEKLYTPADFQKNDIQRLPPEYIEVPGPWSSYKVNESKLPIKGYATYRLLIEVPENEVGTLKALYIPNVSSAYTFWIDGKLKAENGVVGRGKREMEPEKHSKVVQFQVESNRIELVMHVSNFNQRKSGIVESILMGEQQTITQFREKKLLFRSGIGVCLIVIGLYHVALFALRRKELSLLFFGAACIFVSVRATLLDDILASHILPFLSWESGNKLEYLGASLGILFFMLYTYTQFPMDMNMRIRNLMISVMSIYSLFVIFTPSIIFTKTMLLLQILIILIVLYIIFVDMKALLKKRESSLLNALSNLLLLIAILNDVLFYNFVIQTTELASVGLLFFLFTQSIILSRRYSNSFKQAEKLSRDLASLNVSLEQQVHERTMELQYMNKKLQTTNEKLKESHQSRSKWIRNISHEIATPLTSIRAYTKGILDGVIQGENKYIQLVHEQSLYLSRLLNDLHDMTEIENREIKFNMRQVNVSEFIGQLYDKYKVDIEKQEITFLFKDAIYPEKGVFATLDTLRIEQVVLNLLTNAQKFIKRQGIIELEVGKKDTDHLIIQVKDNGTGITEEEIDLVFMRFFKSGNQERSSGGSGLGLAIAKEIVEYHAGTMGVQSKEGEGSCFYFTLPVVK